MNCEYIFPLHKLVKYPTHSRVRNTGGTCVKGTVKVQNRDALEAKMADVFSEKIKTLSTDLQQILIDDMVTAFENRLNVLNRASDEGTF
jgi:hypothetical protein